MASAPYRLLPLSPDLPIAEFSCGDAAIDAYFHRQALPEQALGYSAVTVAVDPAASNAVIGYFTLSPISLRLSDGVLTAMGLAEAPYTSVGGYLLGRLGMATEYQGQGIGAALVMSAVAGARRGRAEYGGLFLAVDAKTDQLVKWYTSLGFRPLARPPRRLVLRL